VSQTLPNAHAAESKHLLSGVPKSAESLALSELIARDHSRTIIHVAANDRDLSDIAQTIGFFSPGTEVIHFPAWDTLPYDRASPQASIMAERMHALSILAGNKSDKPRLILTTANAILQKLPPRSLMLRVAVTVAKGQRIHIDSLVAGLVEQGYRRAGKAMEPGEFALRGSIIDIVSPGRSEGLRVDLFGDDIESIKPFDPMTQLTSGSIESASFLPVSEVMLSEKTSELFRSRYRELFGAVTKDDPLYESVSQLHNFPGMEHWLPLFYEHTDTLFDYAGNALITFDAEAVRTLDERRDTINEYYLARKEALSGHSKKTSFAGGVIYNPLPPEMSYVMDKEWDEVMARTSHAFFSPFQENTASPTFHIRPVMRFVQGKADFTPFDQLKERAYNAAESGRATLVACYSKGSLDRLHTLLMERGFHVLAIDRWQERKNIKGKTIGLTVLPLEGGFETPDTLLMSEQDVLGERIVRAVKKKKTSDVFMAEAANFSEGELVVHKEHGIGRFEGLVTVTVSNAAHDCLRIIYDGGDKLFLPVENIDMVSRFGLEEEGVGLDKLGGASWQSRKAKLKERIKIAAEALLRTAAERQIKSGEVVESPHGSYDEFISRFPFAETDDQERSIDDVRADLGSGKPMDRLICGDVGFGKTEVALRAAFIAASNKLQVALICPTTLLARQHYKNFKARFEGFPVTVRQLSRMVSAKDMKDTKEKLKTGEVDIVIGTHALLAKTIEFKHLGLVIVDEEQHFGVGQKEKLKELKSDVHVLTLSATPIPRTLQMALTGVRDLSLITTPPVDRLAVRSFVMPFDPVVIREALMREQHRGGRSFLVCPRIKDIADIKAKMAELVPEIKIAVAHGQMAPSALDDIMNDFYDGKYDALLSTAIIESGLDIPTANTMIIFNAHRFGLAQLYQMRGRVGRGKIRAYAYFVLPHHKELSKNATKRLEVMQTLDTLGAGFQLASHDMDIRGFGNLVGEEQSGHIREVGIELYQQMLEEAVEMLKSQSPPDGVRSSYVLDPAASAGMNDWSPTINLGLSVLIPESYVNDLDLRLGLYRRLSGLETEEDIDSFAAELIDRFGPMPEETGHLISVLEIKLLCKKAGISRVDVGPKGAVLSFHNNIFANPEALLKHIDRNPRTLKARADQKLIFTHEWKKQEETIGAIKTLAGDILRLL